MLLVEIISKIKNIFSKRSILSENLHRLDEAMASLASGASRKYSGVARVKYALGQETFLCPYHLQQKAIEFEVKNRCKSEWEAKEENLL